MGCLCLEPPSVGWKAQTKPLSWAVVVAQLVERSPPTPEIRGSNAVIGKLLSNICLLSTVLKRRK